MLKPKCVKKKVQFRNIKGIDHQSFFTDIQTQLNPISHDANLQEKYDCVLRQLLDEHAPLITREITRRPAAWYTPEIKQAKRDKRGPNVDGGRHRSKRTEIALLSKASLW